MTEESREAEIISRVIDRQETAEDWIELRGIAARDGSLWPRLASAFEQDCHLRGVVGEQEFLPEGQDSEMTLALRRVGDSVTSSEPRGYPRTWAVGGLLLLSAVVLLTVRPWKDDVPSDLEPHPALGSSSRSESAPESLDSVVHDPPGAGEQGPRVSGETSERESGSREIGELPRLMVQQRPAKSGRGFEVIYLRRVLESLWVEDLYEVAMDENGRFNTSPIDPLLLNPVASF